MGNVSRHKTREAVLQALYSRSQLKDSFSEEGFFDAFYEGEMADRIDRKYFREVVAGVIGHETELLAIIVKFAPKFDIASMPLVNLLPIMIASYEMIYLKEDPVPEKVSIDEALEITKTFSDESARGFVNGVLNALKDQKTTILSELPAVPEGFALF